MLDRHPKNNSKGILFRINFFYFELDDRYDNIKLLIHDIKQYYVMWVYDVYSSYGCIFVEKWILRILVSPWIKFIESKEVKKFIIII